MFTRRETLASFAIYALLAETRAKAGTGMARWIDAQQSLAEDLAQGRIDGKQWSAGVQQLAATIDLDQLTAELRRARITASAAPSGNDPRKRFVRFVDEAGQARRLGYGVALFDFAPGNVITPHGHRHMVSAHMVLNGAVRIRNFDRVGDEPGAMLIRPTHDYVAGAGQVSTMCSERDNIHWFVPDGGPATTFDIVISGLDPGMPDYEIKAVDPLRGQKLAAGVIRAPIIDFDQSSRLYTASI